MANELILIVEDNPKNLKLLGDTLERTTGPEQAPGTAPEKSAASAAALRTAQVASISGRFALIGLGDELPTVSLRTVDDQLRILEAVAAAVAKGKTSGLVAHTLVTIVRAANQILVTD